MDKVQQDNDVQETSVRPKKIIRFSGHFWQKQMRQAGIFFFFFFLLMKQARELFFYYTNP